jgi:hypothetical protein
MDEAELAQGGRASEAAALYLGVVAWLGGGGWCGDTRHAKALCDMWGRERQGK